jgi:hypothetical protein
MRICIRNSESFWPWIRDPGWKSRILIRDKHPDPQLCFLRRTEINWSLFWTQAASSPPWSESTARSFQRGSTESGKTHTQISSPRKEIFIHIKHPFSQCCGSASSWCISGSDFTFWCRSRSGSGSASKRFRSTYGPTPAFHMLKNKDIFPPFIHSNASLQWFSFLISDKGVMILSILDSILKFFVRKYKPTCAWNWYRSGLAGSESACHGGRFRSWSGKIKRIRPGPDSNLGPCPQHCIFIFYHKQEACPFISTSNKPFDDIIDFPSPASLICKFFYVCEPYYFLLFNCINLHKMPQKF